MAVSFEAIGEKYVTFLKGSGAAEGEVCKLTANRTVGACAEDDAFCGVVSQIRGNLAAVTLSGYAEVSYSGSTAPTVGYSLLSADGEGGVAVNEDGKAYLVVSVDTTNKMIGLFL